MSLEPEGTADAIDASLAGGPSGRRHLYGIAVGLAVVTVAFWGVFRAADWYAGNVSLPRYCADIDAAVARVERVLTQTVPVGAAARRPYIIAAKLVYLVPQGAGEPTAAYLDRLRARIEAHC